MPAIEETDDVPLCEIFVLTRVLTQPDIAHLVSEGSLELTFKKGAHDGQKSDLTGDAR